MAQVVSIVPTLMWLQHRLGQGALGNIGEDTERPVSQKTIQFTPNRDLRSTNLDTMGTGYSTDVEANSGSQKERNSESSPKEG